MTKSRDRSTSRGEPIDSVVPEKAFVLRGENRIDHVPWHFFRNQLVAETLRHARFAQWNSISIEQGNALYRRAQQRRWDRHQAKTEMSCEQDKPECDDQRSSFSEGRASACP